MIQNKIFTRSFIGSKKVKEGIKKFIALFMQVLKSIFGEQILLKNVMANNNFYFILLNLFLVLFAMYTVRTLL